MKVRVYGFSHSPWVQAVLLALHNKKIDHSLSQNPPLEVFAKWGVYMPAISFDEGPWEIESTQMLTKLGYKKISYEELNAANAAWQGVLHRIDSPFRFFSAFSLGSQTTKSILADSISNFILSFVAFYMFILINIGKLRLKQKEPENFGDQFLYWENLLKTSEGPFLDGNEPNTRDLILFGIVQCHSSIPVPPLNALLKDERLKALRTWISKMQDHFIDYPFLYSATFFEPRIDTKSHSLLQRIIFFFGLSVMFITIPVSVPTVLLLMAKVKSVRIKSF